MRRIIGIDPGSRITGYGVIDSDGRESRHIASGCLTLVSEEFPKRLGEIFTALSAVIEEHRPTEMAIEQVFMAKNAASALKLGQARGAAICAGVMSGLSVSEYSPRSIKQAIVGTGSADKEQVQHMVNLLLGITQPLKTDQSDALAVALSHAHSMTALGLLQKTTELCQ